MKLLILAYIVYATFITFAGGELAYRYLVKGRIK